MDKLGKKRWILIGLGGIVLVLALACGVYFALGGGIDAYIDAPSDVVLEDLGTYTIPVYDVVDSNGMILADYRARLVSVTDPDGGAVDASYGSIMVEIPGVYTFVYTADARNVKDVAVKVDFGDRTAPTVSLTGTLPDFFVTGNTYKVPSYTVAGDAAQEKCWAKVFYLPSSGEEQEVEVKGNRFQVEQRDGKYAIRIHVEDAAGNFNDYEYARSVDGPEHYDEDTVLYFGEEFGQRQVEVLEPTKYTGKFVSRAEAPDRVYGEDTGAYQVSFTGVETQSNEGYIIMKTPAILDISDSIELEMYVYNDSDADILMGSRWWNDQPVKKGEWTRLTWPVDGWGGSNGNVGTDNIKTIGTSDISGTNIRFIFDYSGEVIPTGTFYLSPMRAVRVHRGPSVLEAGEHVILDKTEYTQGDTVLLRAEELPGKVVDCFLVDGVPVVGESFIPTEEKHKITVQYTDKLTIDTMTWGERFYDPEWYANVKWLDGNNCVALGANEGTSWALSFDVTGGWDGNSPTNQLFNVAVHIGKTHIIEFQINRWTSSTCKWYGEGAWGVKVGDLSKQVRGRFVSASEKNPVNVLVIRKENNIYVFADEFFIGKTTIDDKPIQGDWFGYAARVEQKGIAFPTIKNLKAVMGEERTELVYEQRKYYLTVDSYSTIAVIDGDVYRAPAAILMDIDGNKITEIEYSMRASDIAGETLFTSGRDVKLTYPGAIDLTLNYAMDNPSGEGKLRAYAFVTVQRKSGLIMTPSKTAVTTIDDHGSSVSYDSSRSHGGDSGSIKVTAKAGDVGVCLNRFRFTGYDYVDFWVYTDRENTMSGAYWLGDTPLEPGEWTRVRIKLGDKGVYLHDSSGKDFVPNGYHKGQPYEGSLVLRFMGEGSGAGAEFWVSSVQAGVFGPVTLTTKNCSAEKTSYMQGDIITLIPQPPEGMTLDYFSINGKLTENPSFEAVDQEYVVEAFYKPATTVMGINEFSVPSIGKGESQVEFDASLRHGGDSGSVKVTVPGGDCFVFLRKFDYTGYDFAEFYVYTETENTTAGVWWLGDTPLRAGKWTRVRIDLSHVGLWLNNREIDVNGIWPNRDDITPEGNLVVRLFGDGCAEGTQFWISSVTVSKKGEASTDPQMVVDAGVNDYDVTHDAQSAQYTSDHRYTGPDTLVTGNDSGSLKVTVGGGEASVGVYGAVVDDVSGYDQVYYYAYTDAEGLEAGGWWCGDTALIPGQWTRIVLSKDMAPQNVRGQSIFTDTPDGFAYRIKGGKAGDTVYVTSLYAGDSYKQMPAKITVKGCSADQESCAHGDTVTLTADTPPDGMAFAYFKVNGQRLEGNTFTVEGGTEYTAEAVFYALQAKVVDVNTTQVQGISGNAAGEYVTDTQYNGGNKLVNDQGSLKVTVSGSDSAICVNNPLLDDIGMYDQVYYYAYTESTGVVAGGWWCGDTVLKPGQWTAVVLPKVPANQYSTSPQNSSGKPIFENGPANFVYRFQNAGDGATVYVTSLYAGPAYEKVTVTLDGCSADKVEYMMGDTVNLTVDPPADMELDYITVNGKIISGLSFTVEELVNEVKAVYKPAEKVLNSTAWASVLGTSNGSLVVEDTARCYGNEASSLKITAAGSDNGIFLPSFDFTGYDYAEFYVYTEASGAQAGTWWCGDTALTAGQWTKVRVPLDHTNLFLKNPTDNGEIKPNQGDKPAPVGRLVVRLMGCAEGTEFWVSSVTAVKSGTVSTEPQMVVNANVAADKYSWQHNGGSAEYTTEKPYAGGNALVRNSESGSLKVTVNGAEASVGVYGAVVDDISQYDQVYFYVYTDAEGVQSGGWWCGDTALTPGQWTRVDLTKAMKPQNVSGKSIFEDTPDGFAYRFMKAPAGTVFYVTSLYAGTPSEETPVIITTTNCTTDQESYFPGQTVTLTAQVPEGMVFDYFAVNGNKLDGNTFTVEADTAYSAEAVCHAASKQVLGISGGTVNSASGTCSGSYTNEKVYDGGNPLVRNSDSGSLKVTVTSGNDAAIYVSGGSAVQDISMYDQVYYYAYTDDAGIVAGGWWCGDTALVPGQWTRVVMPKVPANSYSTTPWNKDSQPIFENGPENFVYRFQGAEGKTVYVTSLYAGPAYEQTAITINLTNCVADKESYFPGQTVTLTAQVPEGMVFDYFTVNGERLSGRTFTVEDGVAYTAEAVYHAAPRKAAGISGGTVISASGTCSGEYTNEKVYDGGNPLVRSGDAGSLKVTVTSGNDAAIYVSGGSAVQDISMYDQVYYYAYTDEEGIVAGGWWCGDTALAPGQWTRVVMPKVPANSYSTTPWNKDSQPIFENGPANFVYRFQGAEGKTVYVTSLYAGAAYEQTPVTVHATNCTVTPAICYPGQSITLTADPAEDGFCFNHFVVNGEAMENTVNSYTLAADAVECSVEAIYIEVPVDSNEAELSDDAPEQIPVTITVTGCTTDKESYLPGETVTLKADEPEEGKVFSHFTVNDEKLEGNSFEVKAGAQYTVKAIYAAELETASAETPQTTNPVAEDKEVTDETDLPDPEKTKEETVDPAE